MNRIVGDLSALLLSLAAGPVVAIPPPPPDHVRVVRVLDGNTMLVTPTAIRSRSGWPASMRRNSVRVQLAGPPWQPLRTCSNQGCCKA
jgi:hypothetical protein